MKHIFFDVAQASVYKAVAADVPLTSHIVRFSNFSEGIDYDKVMSSFVTVGAQATSFGAAVNEINYLLSRSLVDDLWIVMMEIFMLIQR
jgi:hypothetical protein